MYKPPLPQDDEPQDIPEFSYPASQRRASRAGTAHRRRVPGDYRTDERPGEPKIKRASLLREQQEKQAQLEEAAHEDPGPGYAMKRARAEPSENLTRIHADPTMKRAEAGPSENPARICPGLAQRQANATQSSSRM